MNRRGFLTGVASLLAAPAIVRAGSLMPVSVVPPPVNPMSYLGQASLKAEGAATAFDPYVYTNCNYEWFIFNDPRGAFGTAPNVGAGTVLPGFERLCPETGNRFRLRRWSGKPLQLG